MQLIWERLKVIIEPSAAVGFAAILKNKNIFSGKKTGLILCGGNIDLKIIPWLQQ
jgi:threonine dehydratase